MWCKKNLATKTMSAIDFTMEVDKIEDPKGDPLLTLGDYFCLINLVSRLGTPRPAAASACR